MEIYRFFLDLALGSLGFFVSLALYTGVYLPFFKGVDNFEDYCPKLTVVGASVMVLMTFL